jgi:hypothetical protein
MKIGALLANPSASAIFNQWRRAYTSQRLKCIDERCICLLSVVKAITAAIDLNLVAKLALAVEFHWFSFRQRNRTLLSRLLFVDELDYPPT